MEAEYKELKKHYVYELVNGHTQQVFYVGKGQDQRALQHKVDADNSDISTPKLDRIREIKESGQQVVERIIGRYTTAKEAFAVESTLIHWVYGYDNLTNEVGGHGCDSIRPDGHFEKIEGIDIPERVHSFDGAYSNEHIALRESNNIISFMEDVKSYVEKNTGYLLSKINTDSARFTRIFYPINEMFIVIGTGHTSKHLLWIEVQAIDGKLQSKDKIIELCKKSSLKIKNKGSHAKLPNFKSTPSKLEITASFNQLIDEIANASGTVESMV